MTKRIRAWSAAVAAMSALSGAGLPAFSVHAAPPPLPNSMASTGDSITRAFDVGSCCVFSDAPQYSWSTGTDPQVNSQYQRLLALNPGISGHVFNDAVTGAKMVDLNGQLTTVASQHVGYVTVLMGANDICTSTIAGMTPTATFKSQLHAALVNFFAASSTTLMQMLSIPNIYQLWLVGKDDPNARSAWASFGICQSMLSTSNTEADRQTVLAQEKADNNVLRDECALFANCLWDKYVSFNFPFPFSDVSTVDYFHPNFNGQNDAATGSWNASYWSTAASTLLRVASSPAVPTQISVDGQVADSWGLNWLKEPPGSHSVCFNHVDGWTEPPCQTVTVNSGATTSVTGSFTQRGFLHVVTSPAVPSQITLDGIPTDDWGMFTDVPTGSHVVCFGAVPNFNPPACQNITVTAGNLTSATGNFVSNPGAPGQPGMGFMRIASNPAVPTQISIKAGAGTPYIADSWGLNWLELPPGSYTVSFSHAQGYTEPAPQTVSITAGNTTVVPANFLQRGFLRVVTSPAVAGTIAVDSIPRNDWGMWTDVPGGSHTVCFGAVAAYANTPACQTVTVNPGVETDVTGSYS
jgi:lysophospholipase L1-like esterase